jgi:hypothetical protein
MIIINKKRFKCEIYLFEFGNLYCEPKSIEELTVNEEEKQ